MAKKISKMWIVLLVDVDFGAQQKEKGTVMQYPSNAANALILGKKARKATDEEREAAKNPKKAAVKKEPAKDKVKDEGDEPKKSTKK